MIVELVCDGLPNKVLMRGTVVAWRPALPRLRVRAGATVEFAADEDEKRRFVLAALAGELKPPKRKHTRIPWRCRCASGCPGRRSRSRAS